MEGGINMEERKQMYEFDLGFMGKIICSTETALQIQALLVAAGKYALKTKAFNLIDAYDEIYTNIFNTLISVGYYN